MKNATHIATHRTTGRQVLVLKDGNEFNVLDDVGPTFNFLAPDDWRIIKLPENEFPFVEMGFGKVAYGHGVGTDSRDGVPCLAFYTLPEAREAGADCQDIFPVGIPAPADTTEAAIFFHTVGSAKAVRDCLNELIIDKWPDDTAPYLAGFSKYPLLKYPAGWFFTDETGGTSDNGPYLTEVEAAYRLGQYCAGLKSRPVKMVLYCPNCAMQHIDAPDLNAAWCDGCSPDNCTGGCGNSGKWTNPPHRSHLCAGCGFEWRPADVATEGVATIATKGKNDSDLRTPIFGTTAQTAYAAAKIIAAYNDGCPTQKIIVDSINLLRRLARIERTGKTDWLTPVELWSMCLYEAVKNSRSLPMFDITSHGLGYDPRLVVAALETELNK